MHEVSTVLAIVGMELGAEEGERWRQNPVCCFPRRKSGIADQRPNQRLLGRMNLAPMRFLISPVLDSGIR